MKEITNITALSYSTRFINQNFRIKVYGVDEQGKRINSLMGVAGMLKLIGAELLDKFIGRALKAGLDKVVCKLRRGLQISFYAK